MFEAHGIHDVSIDKEDDEQGISHVIEHIAFLGIKMLEILGTGARSKAYTDFHHTVLYIHSQTSTKVRFSVILCLNLNWTILRNSFQYFRFCSLKCHYLYCFVSFFLAYHASLICAAFQGFCILSICVAACPQGACWGY
ncbi:hypothetical protein KSP40_PGU015347 [Platanthera guangdongensis]|uniref:Peptidase M16 N-terminal domain-containing protein n=1 Tax=Platanthera guangdongensis TaxID=2320717 RepID=A0ABR2MIL7_9ASPA